MNLKVSVILAFFVCQISFVAGAEPKKLGDREIAEMLPRVVVRGENTKQIFAANGATTYEDRGRATYGTWRVEADKYCSQWPPNRAWSCYLVIFDPDTNIIVWRDDRGRDIVNSVEPKN